MMKCYIPMRFVLCFMIFLGLFNLCTLRNILGVALVTMKDKGVVPKQIWNIPSQSVIMMSFYPTIIVTNFSSGWMSSRFSGKTLCGLGVLFSALVTFFLPVAAERSYSWLIVTRSLQGLFQGCVAASFCTMYGKWFPVSERAVLKSVCQSGSSMGLILGNPITGYLCASNILGGWPATFYLFGTIAFVWSILWWAIIYESPKEHPWISEKELKYILQSQGEEYAREVPPIPWSSILRSSVVWSFIVHGMFMSFFGEFMRLLFPTYLSSVYNFHVTKIGWLSMIPHVLDMVVGFIGAALGDFVVSRNPLSRRTLIRKTIFTIASIPLVCSLIGVTFVKDNGTVVVALITAAVGFSALNAGGAEVGIIEMSPVFAGAIAGLTNACENTLYVFSPLIIGAITAKNESSPESWNTIFYISLATHCIGMLIYLIFSSADLQPWGLGTPDVKMTSAGSLQQRSNVITADSQHQTRKSDKANRDVANGKNRTSKELKKKSAIVQINIFNGD